MSELILVTGGARSGKSAFAEKLAAEQGGDAVLYVATAAVFDEEMDERVRKHRASRPQSWKTLEQYERFENLDKEESFIKAKAILVDCIGFLLNNIMFDIVADLNACTIEEMEETEGHMLSEVQALCDIGRRANKTMIFVSNEIGLGLVPPDRSSRYYRDILGRANQLLAQEADHVYFLVSGISLCIK